ncbi:MAG: hypothetical protein ACYTAN_06880 [Planctomycetota bacterium]|jgi:hypothetical protein
MITQYYKRPIVIINREIYYGGCGTTTHTIYRIGKAQPDNGPSVDILLCEEIVAGPINEIHSFRVRLASSPHWLGRFSTARRAAQVYGLGD